MGDSEAPRQYTWKLFGLLLTPSWLSGCLSILAGIGAAAAVRLQQGYEGIPGQQIFAWQYSSPNSSLGGLLRHAQGGRLGIFLSQAQVYALWFGIGLLVFIVIRALYESLSHSSQSLRELNYVHADRTRLLRELYARLLVRIATLAAWVILSVFTLRMVIPDALDAVHFAYGHLNHPAGYWLLGTAMLAVALCAHLHVVLVRLLVGRPRLWHSQSSIEAISFNH